MVFPDVTQGSIGFAEGFPVSDTVAGGLEFGGDEFVMVVQLGREGLPSFNQATQTHFIRECFDKVFEHDVFFPREGGNAIFEMGQKRPSFHLATVVHYIYLVDSWFEDVESERVEEKKLYI